MNKYFKLLLIILIIAVVIPQITLAAWWNPFSWGVWNRIWNVFQKQTPVACTKELKLCPDGSSVSRQGPKCEFAECPKLVGGDKDEHGCIGSAGYSWCETKQKCLREWEEKCEAITTNYTFKSISQWDPSTQQHPSYSIEIYKNKILVKTIFIKDTQEEPFMFTLSPDQKYVAFLTGKGGGTCVYFQYPEIINLDNFSIEKLDISDIDKKISEALNIDINKVIKFSSSWQKLYSIKWISNNQIEASMSFGDNDCPITWVNKPSSAPNKINANVNFTIIK